MMPYRISHESKRLLGNEIRYFSELASTNDLAKALPHLTGLVLVADHQTAGRGQRDRVWRDEPGAALLCSLILPEKLPVPELTALAAVSVSATLATFGVCSRIKWPNDVLVKGCKICGVLIEGVVVGVGLNLHQSRETFLERGLPQAISLKEVAGDHDREEVLSRLLDEFEKRYRRDSQKLEQEWNEGLGLVGRQVHAEVTGGKSVSGTLTKLSFTQAIIDGESLRPETILSLRAVQDD